jgi:uroporphyrin-III C-methyltransferase
MGTVYLVGAGPGAPDLLTLRAARLLERADVVLYDALVHPEVVALAERARRIPVGKRCGKHSTAQRFINRMLVEFGRDYPVVVRLKGGDPLLFARAREEMDALDAAGIQYEVVPGITAALAAAASLKTPLTERGSARSVTFATPSRGEDASDNLDWAGPARSMMLYMASRDAERVAKNLLELGFSADTPVVVVENASLPGERQHTTVLRDLSDFAGEQLSGPALVCVGEVFRGVASRSVQPAVPLQRARA